MSISNIIALFGGIALFLFGMTLMGEGLKKVAGNKLELVLYRLSGTPLRGVLLGTGVTAIIQSSSATSVMVVGFVNSGMMKLNQAAAVIEGALIGTSVTGWILCLSSVSGSGVLSLLSTANLTAVVAVIGIILRMFGKKQIHTHIGDIMLGFSVLMYGMSAMSSAVSPLRQSEVFINLLTTFSNPILGIAIGAAFTAVIQSASAAVGILQALSMTGAVTFATAYPIILGIAIGAAVPVLLSALGSKTDGRRASLAYLIVEIVTAGICALLYYGLGAFINFGLHDLIMDPVSIALVNSVCRAVGVAFLLPMNELMIKLICLIIKDSEGEKQLHAAFARLDQRFLAHPALAIEQSRLTVNDMADAAKTNFSDALALLRSFSEEGYKRVEDIEQLVDEFEDHLGDYLVKITAKELDEEQIGSVGKYLHAIGDLERISDHAMNIAEVARTIQNEKLEFTPAAQHELDVLISAVGEILALSVDSFRHGDLQHAYKVEPLEECIDLLCDEMKIRHIERVQSGLCSLSNGFAYNDLITNFERVSDHCSNVAVGMIGLSSETTGAHDYLEDLREHRSHDFDNLLEHFVRKYAI